MSSSYQSLLEIEEIDKITSKDLLVLEAAESTSRGPGTSKQFPIFCKNWQVSRVVSGGSEDFVTTDQSDVTLHIPQNAVETETTFYAAVSTNLPLVRTILELDDSEFIVSPVAEYVTDPSVTFQVPVTVHLPHFLDPDVDPEQLIVYAVERLRENGGVRKNTLTLRKGSTSGLAGTYSMDATHVTIFTSHFTAFCATCRHPLSSLRLRLYGRYSDGVVKLNVSIWDQRMRIADFAKVKRRMFMFFHSLLKLKSMNANSGLFIFSNTR
jgi:hypothetical protein